MMNRELPDAADLAELLHLAETDPQAARELLDWPEADTEAQRQLHADEERRTAGALLFSAWHAVNDPDT